MSDKRKTVPALPAFTGALLTVGFLLWLITMVCFTLICAQFVYDELAETIDVTEEPVIVWSGLDTLYDGDSEDSYLPGQVENHLLRACDNGNSLFFGFTVNDDWPDWFADITPPQRAVVVTDSGNQVYLTSDNCFYFPYYNEDDWCSLRALEDLAHSGYAYVVFDPATLTDQGKQALKIRADVWFWRMRFTGVLDGSKLIPQKIEFADYAADPHMSFDHQLRQGERDWELLYESAAAVDGEQVVLYTTSPEAILYDPGNPVTYEGVTYKDLRAAIAALRATYSEEIPNYRHADLDHRGLWQYTYSVTRYISNQYVKPDGFVDFDRKFCVSYAIHASPIKIACEGLRWLYLATLALTLLAVALLRKLLQRRLLAPLQDFNHGVRENWRNLWEWRNQCRWQESDQLMEHYFATQDRLRRNNNELNRLQTALGYAKEAEENRRHLTSSIAHELKTPLAVIHSYAEGLQERIHEEKREQYLQVILSEVQRMDGMVLEMLDLSRLEAGKVKLARDTFSLERVARATFDRLALAVQAKELQVQYDIRCDSTVIADEARIGQVITNFATNAVKYTIQGGRITVKICQVGNAIGFHIENQCASLSQEALSKVWDTFYRTDSARSGEGTGLGLAISKSIIELHGGQVSVSNTLHGVEFRFLL